MPKDLQVPSDQYFNNKKYYDQVAESYGVEVCAEDAWGGYVAEKTDKWGVSEENAKEDTEEIHARFGLYSPNEKYGDNKY